ncbi:hypothetical protein ADS79_08615 [Brevibacillus reuszeri]|uniref:Uncharacterized protein n=1 Tax=Brevibacillus reuszeri TaxID=54915 RepID=A0A0K9YZ46_9BACL|nr:hypothetical protein ADS79_08615 [Brevibacillus reuszeri]
MAATSTSGIAYSYAYVGRCLRVHVRQKNSKMQKLPKTVIAATIMVCGFFLSDLLINIYIIMSLSMKLW